MGWTTTPPLPVQSPGARRAGQRGGRHPPRKQELPSKVQSPQRSGRTVPFPRPGPRARGSSGLGPEAGSSPCPPRPGGRVLGPREGEDACLQTRGRERRGRRRAGYGGGVQRRGHQLARPSVGHSPRPLSPIPSRPASPGSGSGVCCSPATAAAAAAAGSCQGRRRRHRDATPQCISFRTPTGPHCPAACRWGRKGGRAAQDMTPG